MSYADRIFKDNCREILTHGVWDTDQNVRPHWEDGTPAHTVKKFGIINRYDLKAVTFSKRWVLTMFSLRTATISLRLLRLLRA